MTHPMYHFYLFLHQVEVVRLKPLLDVELGEAFDSYYIYAAVHLTMSVMIEA